VPNRTLLLTAARQFGFVRHQVDEGVPPQLSWVLRHIGRISFMHTPSYRPCQRLRFRSILLAVVACTPFVGCKGKHEQSEPNAGNAEQKPVNRNVTKENFDKIKLDMTFKEVHDLLGACEILRVDENTVTVNGKVSGRAIEVRRWRDGDSWIVVTFNFGKVAGAEAQGLREEAQELREVIVGKWSQSTSKDLAKAGDSFAFLASGELQAQMTQEHRGDRLRITGGGTWKIEGKTLSLKFTTVDPPSAALKDTTFEIVSVSKEKLVCRKDGKEVTFFRTN
jgi:hypothetical protein